MNLINFLKRKLKRRKALEIKPGDVFLVSYPRSGNTWMRFLLAHLISGESAMEIDFYTIHKKIPDIHNSMYRQAIENLPPPRIIKSHYPFTPQYPRVIYLVRDGRDVMASYYDFLTKQGKYSGSFQDFLLQDERLPYGAWYAHVDSWINSHTHNPRIIIKYEALLTQPIVELNRVTAFIGLNSNQDDMKKAINDSAFEKMRAIEKKSGRPYGDNNYQFIHRGQAGYWREYFDQECETIFKTRANHILKQLDYIKTLDWQENG